MPLSVTYALDSDFADGELSPKLKARAGAVMQGAVSAARAG